jgi:hypothetical protein
MTQVEIQTKLLFIKSIHTLVWLMFVIIIAFILWSGFTANISVYSWLAVAAVTGEGLVLLLFKGSCPLTKLARRYSNSQKENFDIFLPNWLAKYNKLIFGALFCLGLIIMLFRL